MTSLIKSRRKQLGLTQEFVAECAGTTHATIQRLESGKIPMSLKWAEVLSNCLKTHPANLIFSKSDLRIALDEEDFLPKPSLLRKYRKESGLTLTELADLADTEHSTIQRLETGSRKFTLEWAEKLSPYLDTHPANLLFEESSLYSALAKKNKKSE